MVPATLVEEAAPGRRLRSAHAARSRYSYARGNPVNYVALDGQCEVSARLAEGQFGICIQSFIASVRVGGIGFGDNRGFEEDLTLGSHVISDDHGSGPWGDSW